MSAEVGYLIVIGAVWGALIFLLMLATVGLLRSLAEGRRHRRRHRLARIYRAMREGLPAAPESHHRWPARPPAPGVGAGDIDPARTRPSRTTRTAGAGSAPAATDADARSAPEPAEEEGEEAGAAPESV